jgi:hypothetical protein
MNDIFCRCGTALISLAFAAFLALPFRASAAPEETFDVLQIGTQTYKNVTVTTKAKTYVLILHSAGMASFKVADLPSETLKTLGYPDPNAPKTNAASAWAQKTLSKIEVPQMKGVETQLKEQLNHSQLAAKLPFPLPEITTKLLLGVAAALLALYLFYCYCCKQICRKAGHEPGAFVWLPLLQVFPMLKAAEMSPLWFLAFLVPVANVVGHFVWSFKIAQARGKTFWTGIFLFLPVTSVFAFLYLAFSNGVSPKKEKARRPIQLMTLETA